MTVETTLSRHGARIHAHLTEALTTLPAADLTDPDADLPRLRTAMLYALEGGKGVRGALAMETARLVGLPEQAALEVAAAAEAFHTYSLVHDDLPAMDDDDLRRGRPTVHVVHGEALAILVGDALQAQAFVHLARLAGQGIAAAPLGAVIAGLAGVGGPHGMVGGQWMDLAAEGRARGGDLDHVGTVQRLKTGALIEWAATACARLAGADPDPLEQYARSIGLAFQIRDDLLDVEGTEAEAGKAVGKDAGRGKATFVDLLGAAQARARCDELVATAVDALKIYGADADFLRGLAEYIVRRRT